MPGIAGVVLLYYPDEAVFERIQSYLDHVDKLYIIDNSETGNPINFTHSRVVPIHDGENKGIPARLNQAAALAIAAGFDWLLTMDQDSSFSSENIQNYISCFRNCVDAERTAIFGVRFQDNSQESHTCQATETSYLITSGSLINLRLFPSVGPFDENLFIDLVDFDYNFRSKQKNYKVIQFTNIYMEHSLGKLSEQVSLKSLKKTKRSLHAPIRMYYMVRNYFYMRSRYGDSFPQEIKHIKKDLLNRIKNNLLYGNSTFRTANSIFRGWMDYRKNRMGKKKEG